MKIGIIVFIIILVCLSCDSYLVVDDEYYIGGTWITEFEATHHNIIPCPEDTDPSYTLTHTSTLRFDKGKFAIMVDPPVPPFYDMWVTDSVWEGQYFIEGDELILAADCDYDITEVYTFEITGDTLRLSLKIENRVDDNGYGYVVMPLWGGLPWGRAMLSHGGSFTRAELE